MTTTIYICLGAIAFFMIRASTWKARARLTHAVALKQREALNLLEIRVLSTEKELRDRTEPDPVIRGVMGQYSQQDNFWHQNRSGRLN